MSVLVVDEDAAVRDACCEIAVKHGFLSQSVANVVAARELLRGHSIDILLLDLKGPGAPGLELLDEIKTLHPETAVIVMTAFATVTSAVEAMRTGATDYLTKPFALDELATVLGRASERRTLDLASRRLREKLRTQQGLGNMIGRSAEMDKIYRILSKVAFTAHPILILGESGTGKEMVARAIHSNGPNAAKPFIPVDCSSLVPTLVESELFGYVKGAFTGANRSKDGLLVSADGGTIFLDEIGELPLDLQAKLLRALQEKEVRPVGATHRVPVNARILAATNCNLVDMVEQGRFRKDLYYRLNVVNLRLPALRQRREDIPLLIAHFLDRKNREYEKTFRVSDEMLRVLMDYDWPGNVRELEHTIDRACAYCSGTVLQLGDSSTPIVDYYSNTRPRMAKPPVLNDTTLAAPSITSLAQLEKQAILAALSELQGDKLAAAKLLGIGKTTMYRKLKEYGLSEA
ncbi:sigma-54-dependent transcriptional regulator [Alloacidobacterium dinghuense]|nr:sigma-54 dependent transcriptional regulator [Alloacidobacterium dinghuense]